MPPGFDAPDQWCCPYCITDKAQGRSPLSANKQFLHLGVAVPYGYCKEN